MLSDERSADGGVPRLLPCLSPQLEGVDDTIHTIMMCRTLVPLSFTDHLPIHSLILQTSYITIAVHPAINHVLPDDISYFTRLKYYLLNGMYLSV